MCSDYLNFKKHLRRWVDSIVMLVGTVHKMTNNLEFAVCQPRWLLPQEKVSTYHPPWKILRNYSSLNLWKVSFVPWLTLYKFNVLSSYGQRVRMWYDVITVLPFHISISQSTRPISHSTRPISHSTRPISQSTRPISQSTRPISQSTRPIETKLSRNVTFVFLNILYDIRFIRKSPKMAVTLFMLSDLLEINKCILYIPRRRRVQFLNIFFCQSKFRDVRYKRLSFNMGPYREKQKATFWNYSLWPGPFENKLFSGGPTLFGTLKLEQFKSMWRVGASQPVITGGRHNVGHSFNIARWFKTKEISQIHGTNGG
jgi:hypothetical protein